jgi:hypothetical protein
MGKTFKNEKRNSKTKTRISNTGRPIAQTARPTIVVTNYGMKTIVKRVPQVFKELPPPGISQRQWNMNKYLRAQHHRFRAYPPGHFGNEEGNKVVKKATEPEPVQYRNGGSFFHATRKNKNKAATAFHATKLADLPGKYGLVRPLSEL